MATTLRLTKRVMARAARGVVTNAFAANADVLASAVTAAKEGNGESGKSNDNGKQRGKY